jgi:hypothetical protein
MRRAENQLTVAVEKAVAEKVQRRSDVRAGVDVSDDRLAAAEQEDAAPRRTLAEPEAFGATVRNVVESA